MRFSLGGILLFVAFCAANCAIAARVCSSTIWDQLIVDAPLVERLLTGFAAGLVFTGPPAFLWLIVIVRRYLKTAKGQRAWF